MNVPDLVIIKSTIADILVSAREQKDISMRQFVELVVLSMKTHAWCIREEYVNHLQHVQTNAPITENVVEELRKDAFTERTNYVKQLEDYANSLSAENTKH